MAHSTPSVAARIGGSQYAILQKISLAFGGRIRTGIGSPTSTPTCLSRKNSSLCGLLAQMPATIAKTAMQTSSVASENCSFISALYPTGGVSCQTGVCARHPGVAGLRRLPKMSHSPAGFSAEPLTTPSRRLGACSPTRLSMLSDRHVPLSSPNDTVGLCEMSGRFWAASFNCAAATIHSIFDGNGFHTPRIEMGRSWRSR